MAKKQNSQTFDPSNMGDLFGALGFDKPVEKTEKAPPQYKAEKVVKKQAENPNSGPANIGWLFYKDYYAGLSDAQWRKVGKLQENDPDKKAIKAHFDSKNKTIFNQVASSDAFTKLGNQSFLLKTTYPGLVLGTGYTHETGTEGEFKLGFYFDWTTGLPIIPGSSVKGVLRSAFKTVDFIKALLTVKGKIAVDKNQIEKWETAIFGSKNGEDKAQKGGDIFHDAIIVDAPTPFLADDFITPHINRENPKMSPFSNPTPLMFLKVLPEVTFQFQFDLKDSEGLSALEKKELFEEILKLLGIGAKTNVGYGQFKT